MQTQCFAWKINFTFYANNASAGKSNFINILVRSSTYFYASNSKTLRSKTQTEQKSTKHIFFILIIRDMLHSINWILIILHIFLSGHYEIMLLTILLQFALLKFLKSIRKTSNLSSTSYSTCDLALSMWSVTCWNCQLLMQQSRTELRIRATLRIEFEAGTYLTELYEFRRETKSSRGPLIHEAF